jgi:hypothetical protein
MNEARAFEHGVGGGLFLEREKVFGACALCTVIASKGPLRLVNDAAE